MPLPTCSLRVVLAERVVYDSNGFMCGSKPDAMDWNSAASIYCQCILQLLSRGTFYQVLSLPWKPLSPWFKEIV